MPESMTLICHLLSASQITVRLIAEVLILKPLEKSDLILFSIGFRTRSCANEIWKAEYQNNA